MPESAVEQLAIVALGGILGAAGQGVRVIIGLKKLNDSQDVLNYSRLLFSLFISFVIGGIAGVLAALNSIEAVLDKTTAIAFLAAGYAGTDFIEGFMRRNAPKQMPIP